MYAGVSGDVVRQILMPVVHQCNRRCVRGGRQSLPCGLQRGCLNVKSPDTPFRASAGGQKERVVPVARRGVHRASSPWKDPPQGVVGQMVQAQGEKRHYWTVSLTDAVSCTAAAASCVAHSLAASEARHSANSVRHAVKSRKALSSWASCACTQVLNMCSST